MRHDRGLVNAIGVCIGVALLPFALHFSRTWLHSADDDNDDDQAGDDDDQDEDWNQNVLMEIAHCQNDAQAQDEDDGADDTHFFGLWLCPYMLLSSARFNDADDNDVDLTVAQRTMMDAIAESLDLQEGMSVLEIECGWGEFALYLARFHGVLVTGYSRLGTRVDEATRRAQDADVELHTVQFVHGEVNEGIGTFDRIIRIALSEHETPVAEELYGNLLADGGKALVHRAVFSDEDHTALPNDNARFAIAREDITDSFSQTVRCWSDNLVARERQGDLEGFEANTDAWHIYLNHLSQELQIGERGVEQVVYTKLPPPVRAVQAVARGDMHSRDGRAVARSHSVPAAM